jgi:hypothetical protein
MVILLLKVANGLAGPDVRLLQRSCQMAFLKF